MIVDMATHRSVDLLEDRTSDVLTAWLAEHSEIEVVCRDRGGPYADGARRSAPYAIQVADRWHLMHNLTAAGDKVVRAHRKSLTDRDERPTTTMLSPSQMAPQGVRADATRQ